jgi:hypothetical protein
MRCIQTTSAVVTVWLLVWPTIVCGSFVLAAKICLEWCGDLLQDFLFPMVLPAFYVPFFRHADRRHTGLLVGATDHLLATRPND